MLDTNRMADPTLLSALFSPSLDQIRKPYLRKWGQSIGDAALRDAIMANPRLKRRILSQILADCPAPSRDKVIGTPDEPVLQMLLDGETLRLSLLLGMAWHGPTVMEWITWNMIAEKGLRASLPEARLAITSIPQIVRKLAEAPDQPDMRVSAETLAQDGKALLQVWMAGLPVATRKRLNLLVEIKAGTAHPGQSSFVQHVAAAIQAGGMSDD